LHEGKLARPLGAAVADEGQEQQGIVLEQSEVDDLVTLVGAWVRVCVGGHVLSRVIRRNDGCDDEKKVCCAWACSHASSP
jgi:hypothetical protein